MKTIVCYTGGGSRGNPGPAAVGVYVTDKDGVMICEKAETIGNSSNDYADYQAVLLGLQTLVEEYGQKTQNIKFELCLDSEFVKKQLNSEEQINEPPLVPFFIEIHNLRVANFPHLKLNHVSRQENKETDRLVNEALDANKTAK
jgi:ribonuclease HI